MTAVVRQGLMAQRKACWFLIDIDLAERLEGTKARTGLSIAEQIRRAIRYWLDSREWPLTRRERSSRSELD